MKTLQKFIVPLALFFSAIILMPSCQDDEEDDPTNQRPDTELNNEESVSLADTYNDDMQMVAGNALSYALSNPQKATTDNFPMLSPCATVLFDTLQFPLDIIIDYGDTNCLCHDGRYRRGSISLSLSDPYTLEGSTLEVSTTDYAMNDNQVSGEILLTNLGLNSGNNLHYSATSTLLITMSEANGGKTVQWNAERYREWIAGADTPFQPFDDVYLISGEATSSIGDITMTRTITEPLRKEIGCFYYVSGKVLVQYTLLQYEIDYGNGDCDKVITLTLNGNEYTIILP